MKKILSSLLLLLLTTLLVGCGEQSIWQGIYYEHGQEQNEEYGPVFDNYEACKNWALNQIRNSDDDVHCAKNCHDTVQDGTPVCEDVVRTWAPFLGSYTFDNYKE